MNTRINNMKLMQLRKSDEYKAVFIDMVLMGALDKEIVETWMGETIPDYLKPPVGVRVQEVLPPEDKSGAEE